MGPGSYEINFWTLANEPGALLLRFYTYKLGETLKLVINYDEVKEFFLTMSDSQIFLLDSSTPIVSKTIGSYR